MPLDALAADLLALLEGTADRDRGPGTAGPSAVPAAVPGCEPDKSNEISYLQVTGPLGPLGPRKTEVSSNAQDCAAEPDRHCACGSPSWWLGPAGWRCAYCEPRPAGVAGTTLTLASGQWAPGTAPPERAPVTAADLIERHGEIVECCCTRDVLELADDDDLPDFLDRTALEGFARALLADGRLRPLPDPALPPLRRIADEIGDTPAGLLAWARSGGFEARRRSALLDRIVRDPDACGRALLALRAAPGGGLLPLLARALDTQTRTPRTTK